jgi:hypothetical protein
VDAGVKARSYERYLDPREAVAGADPGAKPRRVDHRKHRTVAGAHGQPNSGEPPPVGLLCGGDQQGRADALALVHVGHELFDLGCACRVVVVWGATVVTPTTR